MYRHRRVAPQPAALRSTVKQVHGVTTSAVGNPRKPPDIIGEGTMTRASGGPQGHSESKRLIVYVLCVRAGHRAAPAGSSASGPCPAAAHMRASGGLAAVSLYYHLEAGRAGGRSGAATTQDRSGQPHDRAGPRYRSGGDGDDRRGARRVGRRADPPGASRSRGAGDAGGGASLPPAASHALPSVPLRQPPPTGRLAAALAPEPAGEYRNVGAPALSAGQRLRDLARTGQVRHPSSRQSGDQRGGVPAGSTGRV